MGEAELLPGKGVKYTGFTGLPHIGHQALVEGSRLADHSYVLEGFCLCCKIALVFFPQNSPVEPPTPVDGVRTVRQADRGQGDSEKFSALSPALHRLIGLRIVGERSVSEKLLNAYIQAQIPRGRVAITRPRGCSAIALYLFDPAVLEGPLSHEEAQAVVAEPAYWSFCWASGQALAGYILAHPEWVEGRRIIDFGSGSGIVAIAAALAGAREVIACDLDLQALDAVEANAQLNGVTVKRCVDWTRRPGNFDLVTAADVLYDPDNRPFLQEFLLAAPRVLVADSRVKDLGDGRYEQIGLTECRTWPDLNEFEEFNRVRIYSAVGY